MDPNESYFSVWERFQTLLNRCPQHGLSDWAVDENFYNGLTPETQQRFNTATGGSMLDKLTIEEAEEMFESIALADQHTPSRRSVSAAKAAAIGSSRGVHHVDQNARLSAKLEELTKKVRDLKLQLKCEICHKNHETADCPVDSQEEANTKSTLLQHETFMKGQQVAFQNLEAKFSEFSAKIDQRPSGSLPSDTVHNPGPTYSKPFLNCHAKAVTTRSGRGVVSSTPREEEEVDEDLELEMPPDKVNRRRDTSSTSQSGGASVEKEKQVEQEPMRIYKPKPPYPGRLVRKNDSEQYSRFLDMLKKLHVNIPFIEALANMPKHAKFLKDLLTNKKKLEELSTVILSEECSAVVRNKLHRKMTDPELLPTRMSIQLADRSVKFPSGIVENMLVQVDKFIFPVDFFILDMDEDSNVLLILGRPFLATARALIDVPDGKLILRVHDDMITFDVQISMRHTQQQDDTLYFIDTFMTHVGDYLTKFCERDTSDTHIIDVENQLVEMTIFDFDQEQRLPESGEHEPIMSSQIFSDVLAVE
ncbi:uncharacterized protein LOC143597810 [Bidens hawaiensis]|uniref:uncharacterized protein LOC143597810 n=1 Tax=Bidens hawaiensis TaxID=980011 RepID=UPI004049B2BD